MLRQCKLDQVNNKIDDKKRWSNSKPAGRDDWSEFILLVKGLYSYLLCKYALQLVCVLQLIWPLCFNKFTIRFKQVTIASCSSELDR